MNRIAARSPEHRNPAHQNTEHQNAEHRQMTYRNPASVASSAGLDPARMPDHVAIIMDGNGRWARRQDKQRLLGHWQGYRTLKDIVYAADDLGLHCLTVYGFSSENWRRPD